MKYIRNLLPLFTTRKSLNLLTNCNTNVWIKRVQEKNFSTVNKIKKPFTMKVETPEFESLFTEALKQLAKLFKENSYEIRIAGGAVRDLLSGSKPKDVDFATTATPDEMKTMFNQHNIRMINNKGEKHGTITARIDQENFEVTTLRIDIETDGRHANVIFTKDWFLDSNRRDLTINSMFLGLDGTLYDYFDGYNDLINKRVIFVGDADKRIREDYLRILRYFRFFGRVADRSDSHDQHTLDVIQNNIKGLDRISGERIWLELQKITVGNFAHHILLTMQKIGMYPAIGLPSDPDLKEFETVMNRTERLKNINPITRIAALMRTTDEMITFHERCKLSGFERDLGFFIITNRSEKITSSLDYKKQILYCKSKSGKDWVIELLKYKGECMYINEIQSWQIPIFPLSGRLLMDEGVPGGRKLGKVIDYMKVKWIDSEFRLTTKELLESLPDVLHDLGIEKMKVSRTISELDGTISKLKNESSNPKSVYSDSKSASVEETLLVSQSAGAVTSCGEAVSTSDLNNKQLDSKYVSKMVTTTTNTSSETSSSSLSEGTLSSSTTSTS